MKVKDEFKEWLKEELSYSQCYPNENSHRATATRGLFKEILYQYKEFPSEFMYEVKNFYGLDTPIRYFLVIILIVLLSPILPILNGIVSYYNTIEYYKRIFKKS